MLVAILYLMRRSPAKRRTHWANLYEVAVIGGMSISSELAGVIAGWRTWRWSFGLAAGVLGAAWPAAAVRVAPGIWHILDGEDPPGPVPIGFAIEQWGFQMAAGDVAGALAASIVLSGVFIRGAGGQRR